MILILILAPPILGARGTCPTCPLLATPLVLVDLVYAQLDVKLAVRFNIARSLGIYDYTWCEYVLHHPNFIRFFNLKCYYF